MTEQIAHQSVQNADPAELDKFAARAGEWWNRDGPFKTLHDINPLRLEYIRVRAPLAGARVLDVGCGGGLLAEALAEAGAEVVGIDLAEANLAAARAHAAQRGLTIDYRCIELDELARREPGAFDVVTCLEVLEHVPRPRAIVGSSAEALRPGGSAFFSTINRNVKSFLLAIVAAEHVLRMVPRGTHEYARLIRPAELAAWCRTAGLELRELTGLHFNPLFASYHLGGNVDVNYFAHAVRASATLAPAAEDAPRAG